MKKKDRYRAAGCLLLAAGAAAGIWGQRLVSRQAGPGALQKETAEMTESEQMAPEADDCAGMTALYAAASDGQEAGKENRGTDGTYVLTERQKRILRERHLPEAYTELTALQKESIRTIEELLCYLENKYGRTFIFLEYHPPSVMEPDTVSMLFMEEGDARMRAGVVRRTMAGREAVITDDYPAVAAEALLEEEIRDIAAGCLDARCRVYVFISRTALEQPPEDVRQLAGAVTADACIWLSEESVTAEKTAAFAGMLEEHLLADGIRGRYQVMLLEKQDWDRVSRRDYARFFADDVCLFRRVIRIP